jgi:hypothetical protein
VIATSKSEHGSNIAWIPPALPFCKKALMPRSSVFEALGNTARAHQDCVVLVAGPFNDKAHHERLRTLSKSAIPIGKACVDETNRISIDGWRRIARKDNSANPKALPSKYGHSMICHGDKLYCFGGSSQMLLDPNGLQESIVFWEISISEEQGKFCYEWRELPNILQRQSRLEPTRNDLQMEKQIASVRRRAV